MSGRSIVVLLALAVVGTIAITVTRCRDKSCGVRTFSTQQRLEAMLSVHAHTHPGHLAPGEHVLALNQAVRRLQCDTGPGAESRRRRALAALLADAWDSAPHKGAIAALGVHDLGKVKQVIQQRYSETIVELFEHDRAWREYAILRELAEDPDRLTFLEADDRGWFAALAHAQTPTTSLCWSPEAPARVEFIDPYVTIRTHVSVGSLLGLADVKLNVDPQRWDNCSKFWDPPEKATYLAVQTPVNCKPGQIGDAPSDPSTAPGSSNYEGFLFEHFECRALGCDAWFKNLLHIGITPDTVKPSTGGMPITSHLVTYWLPTCKSPYKVDGYIEGDIMGTKRRVILDEGWMEVWEEGGRTHVESFKKVQFEGEATTWLSAMILDLTELSGEMGELACCEGKAPTETP